MMSHERNLQDKFDEEKQKSAQMKNEVLALTDKMTEDMEKEIEAK